MARARTLEQAAAFVDKVGIALVFGKADVVLPSLWDAVCGPGADWAVRDENGKAIAFTKDFDRLWHWKDDLPDRRLACAGRHLARDAAALVSRKLVPAIYALTARVGEPEDFRELELAPLEREIAEAVLAEGPISAPELRRLLATDDKKGVDKAVSCCSGSSSSRTRASSSRTPAGPRCVRTCSRAAGGPGSGASQPRRKRGARSRGRCWQLRVRSPTRIWQPRSAGRSGRRRPRSTTSATAGSRPHARRTASGSGYRERGANPPPSSAAAQVPTRRAVEAVPQVLAVADLAELAGTKALLAPAEVRVDVARRHVFAT